MFSAAAVLTGLTLISPWIVAIADPRASERYAWSTGASRTAEGCASCERPRILRGRDESAGVFELYTNGRLVAVRPEGALFTGTGYEFLSDGGRLAARYATVMADTVRTPSVLAAGQNPPVAAGMLQERTYLHSGELETATVDLSAGGRAGWDVAFDRTYRSRTIGGTPFGAGWESSVARRLRELPNGNVEYRDGAGEVWLFTLDKTKGLFVRPRGLFLTLARTDRGFVMVSQKKRITAFDAMGRLIHETDEFTVNPYATNEGNVIRYLYDRDGRLAQVVDPLGRASTLAYYPESATDLRAGRLRSITDWRGRTVSYDYDEAGRLTTVALPTVEGERPTVRYAYAAGTTYNDALELAANLTSITDPIGAAPRVRFEYGTGGDRDRVAGQTWATGETAGFTYGAGTATAVDALHQTRKYALTANAADYASGRAHVRELEEEAVESSTAAFGTLPVSASAAAVPRENRTRLFRFTHQADGLVETSTLNGVRTTTYAWTSIEPGAPGWVLREQTTSPATTAGTARAPVTTASAASITRTFTYENGSYLRSVRAAQDGAAMPDLHFHVLYGGKRSDATTNDAITNSVDVDVFGRPRRIAGTGGTDTTSAGAEAVVEYHDDGATHARGLVASIDRAGLVTTVEYPTPQKVVVKDERNVETTTELDAWLRPKRVFTLTVGLQADETTAYDANGRVREVRRKQGDRTIAETYEYDAMGRIKSAKTTGVAVGESLEEIASTVAYDLGSRKIVRTLPGGAVVTELLDGLGRVKTRTTETGVGTLREELVYDLAGNLVYAADNHLAQAFAFDVHGRMVAALAPDGTKTATQYDAMGNPTVVQQFDGTGSVVAETRPVFTPSGRLDTIATKVDETRTRTTANRWDGAGRTTRAATEGRASMLRFGSDGRLVSSASGEGTTAGVARAFQSLATVDYDGSLIRSARVAEKGSQPVSMTYGYDNFGNAIQQRIGSLEWAQQYDQDGNLAAAKLPERPETKYEHDARGSVTAETKPGGAVIRHGYSAAGAPQSYRDPVEEVTSTTTDRIGRPLVRTYPDEKTETFTYDGERLQSRTDREGRTYHYVYNEKGQLAEVRGGGGTLLETYGYDAAGRITRWTTRDAELRYENFDAEGRPRRTRQIRFAGRSGFGGATVRDEHVQEHEWNVHGERTSWTMPLPAGFGIAGWTSRVAEDYDAAGNVVAIRRTLTGASGLLPFLTADYRGAGRPNTRTIATVRGAEITRTYGYDEVSAQVNDMTVSARGLVVGGSAIEYDGVQVKKAALHGVSADARASEYEYDERSRLAASRIARTDGAVGTAIEHVDPADFRTALERTGTGPDALPSLGFAHERGHKIAAMTRDGDTRAFVYGGAERVDDGRFVYEFDARGRLITATEKPPTSASSIRRISYYYAGSDRVVGRFAEYAQSPSAPFQEEDRAEILDADGLPADVTFVWDPLSDTMITVAAPNGAPLRQILQGRNGYDDPVEVAIADGSAVRRLHPIYDEAGAATLQAILNDEGEVVSRTVQEGAYGEDEFGLDGAAVDRIALQATRDAGGGVQSVTVSIRATEQLASSTLPTGARLAAVDGNGAVVRSASVVPTLIDNYTLRWTLTGSEWSALTSSADGAKALSIAVTSTLRAAAWSAGNGILPAPDWAVSDMGPMYSSPTLPVEYRDPLAELATWLNTANTSPDRVLFHAEALSALGGTSTAAARQIVAAAFQGLPFAEPATGLVFARARWYDPSTGTFLSPDPLGYKDSSNLYAFGTGDPVNNRDPRGEGIVDDIKFAAKQHYTDVVSQAAATGKAIKGIAKSVGKTIVGTVAAVNLLHEASKTGNVQAQIELANALGQTRDAVAQWGTSAGYAIVEPELIGQAANELHPDEFAEEISDATILTASFVAPAAKTKAPTLTAPRFRINLANTGPKVRMPVNADITIAPTAAVTPRPPGRPSWRTSEINAADELTGFDFVEQRSYLNGVEVPYGTPGSVRPDLTSNAMRITVDVKNYNLATAQGRYNLVQTVVDQASSRATHLPPGYRQGLILDVRGQTVSGRLLNAMVNRMVRRTGGSIRPENVYFVGID